MISKPSLTETIRQMRKGQKEVIPATMFKEYSVRNVVSVFSKEAGRTYIVNVDRQSQVYIITRTA